MLPRIICCLTKSVWQIESEGKRKRYWQRSNSIPQINLQNNICYQFICPCQIKPQIWGPPSLFEAVSFIIWGCLLHYLGLSPLLFEALSFIIWGYLLYYFRLSPSLFEAVSFIIWGCLFNYFWLSLSLFVPWSETRFFKNVSLFNEMSVWWTL